MKFGKAVGRKDAKAQRKDKRISHGYKNQTGTTGMGARNDFLCAFASLRRKNSGF
jgi:hypothetical protein